MSKLETNQVDPATGTTLTLGTSGDTIAIPSGVTIANSGTATGFAGVTEADQFRLTADLTGSNADITSNLERVDDASFSKIGTGMTNNSGIFSFPSTGLYQIINVANAFTPSQDNVYVSTNVTINNSDYDDVARPGLSSSNSYENTATSVALVNVTDTSNVKVKFTTSSFASNSALQGDTDRNKTHFTFIRLGDSQ